MINVVVEVQHTAMNTDTQKILNKMKIHVIMDTLLVLQKRKKILEKQV